MKLEEFTVECGKKDFPLSSEQITQFDTYAKLLQEWNTKINLTAITDYEDIIEKHFFDSLIPLFETKIDGNVCDVGSGAGFPGIVWKIVKPEIELTILEPLSKRCRFLEDLCSKLNIKGTHIINERAEDYCKEHRETFDVVTARAVANLSVLSELCVPLVKVNGMFIAMKGSAGYEEDKAASKALVTLGVKKEEAVESKLSDDSIRINLIYKKIKETPTSYPRMYGKIKKNPL